MQRTTARRQHSNRASRGRPLGFASLVLAIAWLAGCSTDRDPESFFAPADVGRLVIDGLLVVDKPLPRILVTRALAPDVTYSLEAAGVGGASVQVQQLPDGPVFVYGAGSQNGVYEPQSNHVVLPNTSYALRVTTSSNEVVTATTTTPTHLNVAQWLLLEIDGTTIRRELQTYEALGDSVYFAPENQLIYSDGLLEARFPRPDVLGFQIGVFSLDPDSDFVIEPEFFEDEDFEEIERQGSSPALEVPDGNLRLPWFTIFFTGRYKIRVMALDPNAIDWVRSLPQGDGGFNFGGNIGDGFERPIFNVNGGIGLFGSASADSIGFFINKRPGDVQ